MRNKLIHRSCKTLAYVTKIRAHGNGLRLNPKPVFQDKLLLSKIGLLAWRIRMSTKNIYVYVILIATPTTPQKKREKNPFSLWAPKKINRSYLMLITRLLEMELVLFLRGCSSYLENFPLYTMSYRKSRNWRLEIPSFYKIKDWKK